MKKLKSILSIAVLAAFTFTSCQTEESELINEGESTNSASSKTADLLVRSSASDGSDDDILDGISCASVVYPVVAEINGQEYTFTNEAMLSIVVEIFGSIKGDDDFVEFKFPIQMQLSNYTVVTINNEDEFEALKDACEDADDSRDDIIKCLDIDYPVTLLTFDASAQQTGSVVITGKREMYNFIDDLEDNQFFSIDYPITATSASSGTITITSDAQLAQELESCEAEDDARDEAEDRADDLEDELEDIMADVNFRIESTLSTMAFLADYTFEFANDGEIIVRNAATGIIQDVEGEYDFESETEVFVEIEFEGSTIFSVLEGTYEVVSQTATRIELQSTTNAALKLTLLKS
ncbi:hypothetical protein [Leeuwenhoekiella nanhaiensis]|uniref:Uncharacterized protein n=1 Tax=Leeuwenhoekiella nanhaiensis TaxID=1655491 RepID=A0A2G1VRV7_9FLAO|nr:hypothetical protein [Leeuwenhoekiella nanhaiensis]PHQ29512.1 hypothetical protein CJ305_09345 [Leeuwenhoekiella nanhaiensis]